MSLFVLSFETVLIALLHVTYSLRLTIVLWDLNPVMESLIFFCSSRSVLRKDIGNALMPVVATVEISIIAHIRNQLAWISIPATKALMIIFLRSDSFPRRYFAMDHITSPARAKLAKFFMIFQIFQR